MKVFKFMTVKWIKELPAVAKGVPKASARYISFLALLCAIMLSKFALVAINSKWFVKNKQDVARDAVNTTLIKAQKLFDHDATGSISRSDLIELALRNMQAKKTRSLVTIGGMAIGIGTIVFLVSIGYGLQELVVSRVARLEEMRQADVTAQPGGKVKINDKTLSQFKAMPGIESVLPLIALVGRVNYRNSVSDMAVFGVTSDYLRLSAIKTTEGEIFDSNMVASVVEKQDAGEVAGVFREAGVAEEGVKLGDIEFSINPGEWVRVRETPAQNAKMIGYTKRVEGIQQGEEYYGSTYVSDDTAGESAKTTDGKWLGKWIKAKVLMWQEQACKIDDPDCENQKYIVMRDKYNAQVQQEGYFAEVNARPTNTVEYGQSEVLGISTESGTVDNEDKSSDLVVSESALGSDFVEIASEAASLVTTRTKTVALGPKSLKRAVVNRAMLKVLALPEKEAVGKKFTTAFVVVGDLLGDPSQKIQSANAQYTIVGVIPDDKTPVFYVPFTDLRSLGITNYSQVKIVVKDQTMLPKIRKTIESLGFSTKSVADTVSQINGLFNTARTLLALLGMVALGVASLGMFNTLTISLLERTREVGLMKAMGMKSSEVKELFLTESMIMGFFGGILGLIIGFLVGKLLGLIISIFTVLRGVGMVDISYLPLGFVVVIVILALFVGIVTGLYPAKRATEISALNALRYE